MPPEVEDLVERSTGMVQEGQSIRKQLTIVSDSRDRAVAEVASLPLIPTALGSVRVRGKKGNI